MLLLMYEFVWVCGSDGSNFDRIFVVVKRFCNEKKKKTYSIQPMSLFNLIQKKSSNSQYCSHLVLFEVNEAETRTKKKWTNERTVYDVSESFLWILMLANIVIIKCILYLRDAINIALSRFARNTTSIYIIYYGCQRVRRYSCQKSHEAQSYSVVCLCVLIFSFSSFFFLFFFFLEMLTTSSNKMWCDEFSWFIWRNCNDIQLAKVRENRHENAFRL